MPDKRVHGSKIARARLATPAVRLPAKLRASAPALDAMTDLADEAPHVVAPDRSIDEALQDMIRYGVRLLLVAREADVVGVITSYDIMGERPIQFVQDPVGTGKPLRHADINVADIMTPIAETRPLQHKWVRLATVADVAAIFREEPHTHLLVVDDDTGPGNYVVRGIFSRTRLERQFESLR